MRRPFVRFTGGASVLALAILAVGSGVLARQSGPARLAFEAARKREVVDRDIRGAITAYRDVVSRHGADRAVAADALVRLGLCYEQLSRPEAAATYQQIVRDYADQPAPVALARTRLAALASARSQAQGVTPRLVARLERASISSMSADATIVAGSTGAASGGKLFFQNLQTGQTVPMDVAGFDPLVSPDGRTMAFTSGGAVRLVALTTGAAPRTLVETGGLVPAAWRPDGNSILALAIAGGRAQGTPQQRTWVSISVADGSVTTIRRFESGWFAGAPVPSPDGRYLAFTMQVAPGVPERQVYVADSTGANEVRVTFLAGSNGENLELVWTPDSSRLLFVNRRSGSDSLWAVAIQDGRAVGNPVQLQQQFGDSLSGTALLGFSPEGALYEYRFKPNSPQILVVDRASNSRVTDIVPGGSPSLSPDGQTMVFGRQRAGGFDLIARSIDTGVERLVPLEGSVPDSVTWLHDGTGFITLAIGGDGNRGQFVLVDIQTGAARTLFSRFFGGITRSASRVLSPDDRTLFLATTGSSSRTSWTGIVAVDVETGEERPVLSFPGDRVPGPGEPALALGPDGRTLAVMHWIPGSDALARLFTINLDGSGYRDVAGLNAANPFNLAISWTPDGQSLLFVKRKEGDNGGVIMRVPAVGGVPVPDGFDSTQLVGSIPLPTAAPAGPNSLHVGPDGSRMVIGLRTLASNELWALDNVLAALQQ